MSERKRGIVCAYCGMAWGYEGETPTPELIKEACDHEAVCVKNPYTAQIRNLKRERDEARKYLQLIYDVADSQRKWNFRTIAKEGLMKSEAAK